ncbi:GNAT family N-acetyltransferase [Saliterribacillus persicus]|uniref:Acetyltransferase (GNAT) family protein n=1 Tax=Saliterribacillus persicus TaxID=930114 RepID=A0A368Y9J3_9BACI|nr:GNAT family N-acetyltransferase [Saliterribacillus persicus]RCW76941.1 acetyltransferase (GNAT) family protein [Saliterribacillus persicus]
MLNVAYSDEIIKKRLCGSFLFVAETHNNIVGFANFSPYSHGEVELRAIYLYSNYRKGIGTALLKEGNRRIDGIREFYMDVEKENTIGRIRGEMVMDTVVIFAFSVAAGALSIALFAFSKIEQLEKRVKELENK